MGGIGSTKPIDGLGTSPDLLDEDKVPLLILVFGKEGLLAEHVQRTRDSGAVCDLFPTIVHLLGHPTPYGVACVNLLLPSTETRPAIPHPLKRGVFYKGRLLDRADLVEGQGGKDLPPRSVEEIFDEQRMVGEILDHGLEQGAKQ
jgi:hypothetical protein